MSRAPLRVVVTGGTGHLGRRVVERFRARGCVAVPLGRSRAASDAETVDLADPSCEQALTALLRGADAVVHCAAHVHHPVEDAPTRAAFHAVNVEGTRRVVRAAERAGVPRLVYASSIGVYRFEAAPSAEADVPCPSTAYASSKLLGEFEIARFSGTRCVLRLATLYGPDDPGNFARLHRLLSLRPPAVPIDPDARKSFMQVDDAAEAIARLCSLVDPPALVNVSGRPAGMRDIVHGLVPAGTRVPTMTSPAALVQHARRWPMPPRARRWLRALESLSTTTVVDTQIMERALECWAPRDPVSGLRENFR